MTWAYYRNFQKRILNKWSISQSSEILGLREKLTGILCKVLSRINYIKFKEIDFSIYVVFRTNIKGVGTSAPAEYVRVTVTVKMHQDVQSYRGTGGKAPRILTSTVDKSERFANSPLTKGCMA